MAGFKAVTFDCYGTLIDWDIGISAVLGPWLVANQLDITLADLVSRFADAQRNQQTTCPDKKYSALIADAFKEVADNLGVSVSEQTLTAFGSSVGDWPPFLDTIDALRNLKRRGLHLGVLSNTDNASFERTHKLLGGLIDTVVTAEMVGAYKPDLKMFTALFEQLSHVGIDQSEILHAAQSRHHDVDPGNQIGLPVVWVDRRAGRSGDGVSVPSDAAPILRLTNLAELADLDFDHTWPDRIQKIQAR